MFFDLVASEWVRLSLPFAVGASGVWFVLDTWRDATPPERARRAASWALGTTSLAACLIAEVGVRTLLEVQSVCGAGGGLILSVWTQTVVLQGAMVASALVPVSALGALWVAATHDAAVPDARP